MGWGKKKNIEIYYKQMLLCGKGCATDQCRTHLYQGKERMKWFIKSSKKIVFNRMCSMIAFVCYWNVSCKIYVLYLEIIGTIKE